jgi:hypothetical protein
MYKACNYLVITYFLTYLPIYEIYFVQNWLPTWNQILTQLWINHNWVIMGTEWMVYWFTMAKERQKYTEKRTNLVHPDINRLTILEI